MKFLKYKAMDYYNFISVEMGNDHLSTRKAYILGWEDEHTPARLVACNNPVKRVHTKCEEDVYWPLNHTHIALHCNGKRPGSTLDVTLESAMPNLDGLKVSLDNKGWRRRPSTFRWRLSPGRNSIRAKSVNRAGREGPESSVVVAFEKGRGN